MEQTEAAVRETILDLNPDVIVFQELPKLVPYIETHDMVRGNPETHSGHLGTLVRKELLVGRGPRISSVPGCALLTTCLLYTSPSPRDATLSRMPSSA